eukprot:644728-Amphidinium_carterae.1
MGVEGVTTLSKPLVVRLRAVAVATGLMKSDGRLEVVVLEAEEAPIHQIPLEETVMMTVVIGSDWQAAGWNRDRGYDRRWDDAQHT